jgi:TfoX/Sxy family transcriptional regulator of competence genes
MGMATRPEAVETILAQAVGACSVAARRMFGEYTLHANGKLVGLICDDQLFIKPTPAGRAFIGEVDEVPPYEGAEPSFLISGEQM